MRSIFLKSEGNSLKEKEMKFILMLCVLLITIPAFAGTFRDDFDKNLDNWDLILNGGSVEIKNGELVIIDSSPEVASSAILKNGNDIKDFKLHVDAIFIKELSAKSWDYMCIMSRFNLSMSDKGFAWVSFEESGNIPFILMSPGWQLFGRNDIPFPLQFNKWYHIQIEVNGSKLTLTVDNKLIHIMDWSNQPMLCPQGSINIGAGGAEVHFDNFVITGDEVPDNTQSVESTGKLTTTWAMIKR